MLERNKMHCTWLRGVISIIMVYIRWKIKRNILGIQDWSSHADMHAAKIINSNTEIMTAILASRRCAVCFVPDWSHTAKEKWCESTTPTPGHVESPRGRPPSWRPPARDTPRSSTTPTAPSVPHAADGPVGGRGPPPPCCCCCCCCAHPRSTVKYFSYSYLNPIKTHRLTSPKDRSPWPPSRPRLITKLK